MRKLGHTSALHLATVNEHVRRLIPPDSPYVCSNGEDSAYPHLIVQFGQGACVCGRATSTCAHRWPNRIIYHDDHDNIRMAIDEAYAGLITEARVFLVSGFNAMHSEELLRQRLDAPLRVMAALPLAAAVFYEDAGFYDPSFQQPDPLRLRPGHQHLQPQRGRTARALRRKVDMLDAAQAAALADLHELIPAPLIVVHSMHWALAYGEGSCRMAAAPKAVDDGDDPFLLRRRLDAGGLCGDRRLAAQSAGRPSLPPSLRICWATGSAAHPSPTSNRRTPPPSAWATPLWAAFCPRWCKHARVGR